MNRLLMNLCYDGTSFSGWQIQPKVRTVQNSIENALQKITGIHIPVTGSGRTDAGVHARNQYAHFDLEMNITASQLTRALNSKLPADIYIKKIIPVQIDFSARYDAIKRSYEYIISKEYNPFDRFYKSYIPKLKIDTRYISSSLPFFLGEKDFTSFSKYNPDLKHCICNILDFNLKESDSDIIFTISANRFLHNMVRRIIGTLLTISHSKQDPAIIVDLFNAKDTKHKLIYTAPPQGLYLKQVEYQI